jgi:Xaa-Pro aminopeptidase
MDKLLNEARLADVMARETLDAVVGVSMENVFYCSGAYIRTQASIRDRLALCVIPAGAAPTLIVCDIEESLARRESWIADVRAYVEFAQSPIATLVDVLKERGLATGRIGVELRYLTAAFYQELVRLAPGWMFVAADEVFEEVRSHKSRLEIERHAQACRLTERAIFDAWRNSGAGETERAIQDRMIASLQAHGASAMRHCTLAAGENAAHAHHVAGDKRVQPGELVRTDFGGIFGGFASDVARMGVVERAAPALQDVYKRIRDAQRATIDYMRPGMKAKEVFNFCARRFRETGVTFDLPHIGHSLRLDGGHEEPILHPANERVLHEDMLICLEPVARGPHGELCGIEDLLLLGPNGATLLTAENDTSELMIIGRGSG